MLHSVMRLWISANVWQMFDNYDLWTARGTCCNILRSYERGYSMLSFFLHTYGRFIQDPYWLIMFIKLAYIYVDRSSFLSYLFTYIYFYLNLKSYLFFHLIHFIKLYLFPLHCRNLFVFKYHINYRNTKPYTY